MNRDDERDDVDREVQPTADYGAAFEPEDEIGEINAAKAKLKKLRDELEEAKRERQEFLDGWLRCKADLVNAKREMVGAHARAAGLGKEILVEELIPALDGFDAAMQGAGWSAVPPAWRSGIESIRTQMLHVLKAHGVLTYGMAGESFDPALHEPIEEQEGGESHTIAKVLRLGYRTKERILRPAQVIVFK